MPLALVFVQLAATVAPGVEPPAAALPDIEIRARVQAREVRIEQEGEARLEVRADPPLVEDVRVERNQPRGATRIRNLDLRLDAQATLADPRQGPAVSARSAATADPGTGADPGG